MRCAVRFASPVGGPGWDLIQTELEMHGLTRGDGFGWALMAHVLWTRRLSCLFPDWMRMSWASGKGWGRTEEADRGDLAEEGEHAATALAGERDGLGKLGGGLADPA